MARPKSAIPSMNFFLTTQEKKSVLKIKETIPLYADWNLSDVAHAEFSELIKKRAAQCAENGLTGILSRFLEQFTVLWTKAFLRPSYRTWPSEVIYTYWSDKYARKRFIES